MDHFYESIPGWSNFLGLTRLLVGSLPSEGAKWVEVGTWKGRSAAFTGAEMIRQGKAKGGRLFCVDTWKGSDEPEHKADKDVREGRLFDVCQENLAPLGPLVEFIRCESVAGAGRFFDAGIDVVFLDAGHDYFSVLEDLHAWGPKVKPGGYMAGDDLNWQGVADAVREFFGNRGEEWELNVWIGPEQYPVWCARKK